MAKTTDELVIEAKKYLTKNNIEDIRKDVEFERDAVYGYNFTVAEKENIIKTFSDCYCLARAILNLAASADKMEQEDLVKLQKEYRATKSPQKAAIKAAEIQKLKKTIAYQDSLRAEMKVKYATLYKQNEANNKKIAAMAKEIREERELKQDTSNFNIGGPKKFKK